MRVVPSLSVSMYRIRPRLDLAVVAWLATLAGSAGCASSTATHPATARGPAVPAAPQRTVAVLPLAGGAGMEGLGFAMSEILARDLAVVPRVRVVERTRLDAVLKELGFAASGRLAPASVPRAGRLVGAERLMSGSVTRAGQGAAVAVALLDVTTGTSSPLYNERLAMNGVIDAQERLADRAFTTLGITLTPAERVRLAKRPTRNIDALIAFGNGRRADALGNATQARTFYAQAARLDPRFVDPTGRLLDSDADVRVADNPGPIVPVVGARTTRPVNLLDDLTTSITDRVVRAAPVPAVCPPICPATTSSTGTVIVRITP